MLTLAEVTSYLLARGLLTPEAVVDGHLTLVDVSSRNQNCAVRSDGRVGVFLKQGVADPAPARSSASPAPTTVAHEAAAYEVVGALRTSSDTARRPAAGIAALLPRCHGYDDVHDVVLLELLDGAEDLSTYHSRTGRFPVTPAARLGSALADLHERAFAPALARPDVFPGRLPWALSLDRPGTSLWQEASNAGLELVSILQATPEMGKALARLRAEWRVDAFVHHDVKWDNCLVLPAGVSRRATRLALVDWEFADVGDAAWDAGAVFGSYLSCWLTSIPVTGGEPPDRYLELARHPLTRMHPAMRAYWSAYVRGRRWDQHATEEGLLRAVGYAGARLLQSAYERTQRMTHLDGNVVCLLQLAVNVMTRPWEAARHLLAIPATGPDR